MHSYSNCTISLLFVDMGNGQVDDSQQVTKEQQPALNTTRLLNQYLDKTDLVLHIGDTSYANGYASVVRDDIVIFVAPHQVHVLGL